MAGPTAKVADVAQAPDGGRQIALYIPFEIGSVRFASITICALKLDHVMKWQAGHYKTALALLSDMAGLPEATLREIRYPDAERVFAEFLAMLTPTMRDHVERGIVPGLHADKAAAAPPGAFPQDAGQPWGPGTGEDDPRFPPMPAPADEGPEFDL